MVNEQDMFNCGEALATDVDEKVLFHGTTGHKADAILATGFDPRICNRGMYGKGVYFGSEACKSHQYTCRQGRKFESCQVPFRVFLRSWLFTLKTQGFLLQLFEHLLLLLLLAVASQASFVSFRPLWTN